MKRVCVIGHFGDGLNLTNGQTIKTKTVTDELKKELGEDQVVTIDSHGGIKTLLKAPFQCLTALKTSENVLMLPAYKGLRVYAPLLKMLRFFYKGRKIHYVTIGGWLPDFIKNKKRLKKCLSKFDGIYVETNTAKCALEDQGFVNVFNMPNFKELRVLEEDELIRSEGTPHRLCTFSRVNRKKGIEDAVKAIKNVNEKTGRIAFSLDIYGSVDKGEEDWFEALRNSFPSYIAYKGIIPFDQSVDALRSYYALLFPTLYFTEGVPGTILDSYASGVPVIASKWENYSDVIEEGKTGIGYSFGNEGELEKILLELSANPQKMLNMRKDCLDRAHQYEPRKVLNVLINNLSKGLSEDKTNGSFSSQM